MAEEQVVAVLPVRRVIFPNQLSSFAIGKSSSVALIEHLMTAKLGMRTGKLSTSSQGELSMTLAVALLRPENPTLAVHSVGTTVKLLEKQFYSDILVRGLTISHEPTFNLIG